MSSIEDSEAQSERATSSGVLRDWPCVGSIPLASVDGCCAGVLFPRG